MYVCTPTYVRAYVKWLILAVVLVLHLSIMCIPEESIEAESFPFLKVRGWSLEHQPNNIFGKKSFAASWAGCLCRPPPLPPT